MGTQEMATVALGPGASFLLGLCPFLSSETNAEKCLRAFYFCWVLAEVTLEGWGREAPERETISPGQGCSIWDLFGL